MKTMLIFALFLFTLLSSYAQRGRVQIQDGTLVTDGGTLLRGSHLATHEEYRRDSTWVTHEYIKGLKELGLNSVRAFTEFPWAPEVAVSRVAYIDSIVKWTKQESMYLIIIMSGWVPAYDSTVYADSNQFIKDFWSFYAPRYKDETHVIYEIANEPGPSNNLPAPDYRSYDQSAIEMEIELYNLIRSLAPETHILLMSPYEFTYNQFINDIDRLGTGIDWSNASIAGHAYTYSSEEYRQAIEKVKNEGFAITVTEFHSFMNEYANMALTKVFEEEFVSYFHFLSARQIIVDDAVYKTRVESSNERWTPDFGTWPGSITETTYQNPYRYWPAIFYNEGFGWTNNFVDEIITGISENDYIAYYNLNFENAPASFEAMCSSDHGSGHIEIRLDSINGPIAGNCSVSNTGSLDIYEYFSCDITSTFTGVHKIFLVFKGTAPDWRGIFNVRSWYFIKSELVIPQTPYHGSASVIPGKIEAEEYDIGGPTISYLDNDTVNHGSLFREDDVDIDTTGDGSYCIAWTGENEWLEYTVSCEKDTVIDIQLRVACWESGNKFTIKLNSKKLATAYLDSIGSFQDWSIVTIENILIPAGENQILRIELSGGNFNLDWLNFIARKPNGIEEVKNNNLITFYPNPAHDHIIINSYEKAVLEIYNLYGQMLLQTQISVNENLIPLNELKPGNYIVKLQTNSQVISNILIIE